MIIFLKIINYLGKHPKEGFTMHDLSNKLKIPYASFYRYVKKMVEHKILDINSIGRSKIIKLNLKHPIAKAHLTTASFEETQEFLGKHPLIKKITQELSTKDVVILFGSYAKGKETKKSDIDILVINKNGKKSISFSKYELLFKKKINPIFLTKREFKAMLKTKEENIAKQALNKHVLLNNPENFWECVLDAI